MAYQRIAVEAAPISGHPCIRHPALVALTMIVLAVGCSSTNGAPNTRAVSQLEEWIGNAKFPVAPVALPDGGLLYGERLTGRIRALLRWAQTGQYSAASTRRSGVRIR